jgi:hypothetical protein
MLKSIQGFRWMAHMFKMNGAYGNFFFSPWLLAAAWFYWRLVVDRSSHRRIEIAKPSGCAATFAESASMMCSAGSLRPMYSMAQRAQGHDQTATANGVASSLISAALSQFSASPGKKYVVPGK